MGSNLCMIMSFIVHGMEGQEWVRPAGGFRSGYIRPQKPFPIGLMCSIELPLQFNSSCFPHLSHL